MAGRYAIGVDYGTNSVRALVVDVDSGRELASHVFNYERGTAGVVLDRRDPHVARQHPADYRKGLEVSIERALSGAEKTRGFSRSRVIGIGVDTTGSTPIPVDRDGTPLALLPRFRKNIDALSWLWKDHTAHREAAEITELARTRREPYLAKCGGTYSSEWFWAKVLHCLRGAPEVFDAAHSWVELADYIPALLTGVTAPEGIKRSRCAAGHKAMFSEEWGGLPSREFLESLDPKLGALRDRLYSTVHTSDTPAGTLSRQYAERFGLRTDVVVAVGAFDAHMGAVGAGIKPGTLVKIIGTSTCDMMVVPAAQQLQDIPGLCGIVRGSILPGYYGLEAGQSAVGDIFNWFVSHLASHQGLGVARRADLHTVLTTRAARLKPGQTGLLALDWHNGNRTILVDPLLSGAVIGLTLHTRPEEIYRALIEGTAFGARMIVERFEEYGVPVTEVVNCGGIAEKNPFLMQTYADILGRPMKVSRSSLTCALGAAIFGAVAAGAYARVEDAQAAMTGLKKRVYEPDPARHALYERLFALYRELHDVFGTTASARNLGHVMKELVALRKEATGA